MRLFLISLLSLFFLSGCEEKDKDPAEEFIGKWNEVAIPQKGIVIQKDGTGFFFDGSGDRSWIRSFTWTLKEDSEGAFLDTGRSELRFDGSYLKTESGIYKSRYERAK